ncbi:hypothetical protein NM208_g2297 [Fusarium decemcellulare]|uniref:Uncharacterized protein n=2 Tax=Fusarium decemcellulare TaxID=57161 RepID=A0ACC1SP64_9HYPO|nr:hypothetical protein NM208_g3502 [Fusarium decemcellulare]KAJ3545854.1 hypothetical protein NM208_g2297 [Fusarium decemcellulare]
MVTVLEGTIKTAQTVSSILLNPALAASGLAFLAYGPPDLVLKVTELDLVKKWVGIYGLKVTLKVLLGLGLGRVLNRLQNIRASNNWKLLRHGGWNWGEEVAVVTGGCNGIGKSTVLGLVQKGVRVAILDIAPLPQDLERLDNVFYWKCDITSPDAVNEAADKIRETLGHPSILINNAGLTNHTTILKSTPEKVSKLFGVNIFSHWYTVKAFLPTMILRNKGHIVTVASMASYVALPTAVEYSASKAAALSFHEGLACEIKHHYKAPGVMTTVVHPMFVNTDMTKSEKENIESKRGKMLEPDDISSAIVKQIFSCRGAQLIVPPKMTWISGIRGFPNWLQETIRDTVAAR